MVLAKPIKEFEGKYCVTEEGIVFSIDRIDKLGREQRGRILKNQVDRYGYYRVGLTTTNRKAKYKTIHRLVAETYINNPLYMPCVNHKDGDKTNNKVDNLEWCTWKENTQHGWDLGLCKVYDRKRQYKSEGIVESNKKRRKYIFYKEDVDNIKGMRSQGFTQQAIGEIMNINQATISHILKGTLLPQERICGI